MTSAAKPAKTLVPDSVTSAAKPAKTGNRTAMVLLQTGHLLLEDLDEVSVAFFLKRGTRVHASRPTWAASSSPHEP